MSRLPVLLRRRDRTIRDTFTDPDATPLGSHAMDSGPGWSIGAGTWFIQSNKLRKTATDATHEVASVDAGKADVTVSADLTLPANSHAGVVVRHTDASNFWLAQLDEAADQHTLFERNAGVFTA